MGKYSIWIGLAFFAFGGFELSEGRIDEAIMYFLVGGAFFITKLSVRENLSPERKKLFTILSWVLILAALLVFLFLVRTDIQR